MELWQILLMRLYAIISIYDHIGPHLYLFKPAVAGMFAGLIMCDLATGLFIGGTLQLMVLGVGTFGGSSMPDYVSGALIGTAFSVMSGSTEIGLAVAVPVGVLLVNCDILARVVNTFFVHELCDKGCEERNWRKVQLGHVLGAIPWALSRALPILVCLLLGQNVVAAAADAAPAWLIAGFKFMGGLLPAVGIGILLRYLPLKQAWPFAVLGFFLAAYLNVPIMGVAIVGLIAAGVQYMGITKNAQAAPAPAAAVSTQGGVIEDDE